MAFDLKSLLAELFSQALKTVALEHAATPILLERPKQTSHGDYACNLALLLAKPLRRSPRRSFNAVSIRATRVPVIEVSTSMPTDSLVKSSTIAKQRNRRPLDRPSATKSIDYTWFGVPAA